MALPINVQRQIDHFDLYEQAGLPVFVCDGEGHTEFYDKNKRGHKQSRKIQNGISIGDRLRFNGREVIIESDNPDWQINHKNGSLIKAYLDSQHIPYELIVTGGKGMRFHIFLSQEHSQDFIFKTYSWLCSKIGLDWQLHGVPENKQANHLLGVIGKQGKLGYYATHWTKDIPQERPKTLLSEVEFPTSVKPWIIPEDALQEIISLPINQRQVRSALGRFQYKKPLLVKTW